MASGNRNTVRVAILLLALLPVILFVGIVISVRGMISGLEAERTAAVDSAARMNNRIAQASQALASYNADDIKTIAGDFLPGSQTAIIQAELQNRLRSLFEANGIVVASHTGLPPKVIGGATYIGLRVIARGQLPSTQKFLHAVETSTPLLFVDRAVMRVDPWQDNAEVTPSVVTEFDIFGAKLPAAPSALPAAPPAVAEPAGIGTEPAPGSIPQIGRSRS